MKFLLICLLSGMNISIHGQSFIFEKDLSTITFTIKNFGVTVKGEFHNIKGKFFLNEDNVSDSKFEADVDAATIDTGVGIRDKHLKKRDYFDVENFPKLKIVSKQIARTDNQWLSVAIITIKGITCEITINFTVNRQQSNRIFTGTFRLNRLDFGVGGDSFSLGDDVVIQVNVVGIEGN